MEKMFLVCAALGGTVFVCQFVMALIGFGAEDLDLVDDVPDDASGDFGDVADDQGHITGHGSTWLFGIISFRTVVAALTFFGLAGYAAQEAGQGGGPSVAIAVACGGAAMLGVHWLMRLMYRLSQDRSLRIGNAVGRRGTIYVPVPADSQGAGKVQVNVQDRLVEYAAMSPESEDLPTGARVVITRVISPTTVEVELIRETVESTDS
jgi:hypothetical protein